MRIFSGECEHGLCGLKTPLMDGVKNSLFAGDIVSVARKDESGIMSFYGISVVVEHRPDLTGEDKQAPFIMGLKNVNFESFSDEWYTHRVKSYEDAVIGEHWKNYGFNYRAKL